MTGRLIAALAICIVVGGIGAVGQTPTFRGETRLVVLHATVKDSRGQILSDLDRGAFTVLEDGKTQPISLFRRDDVPVTIGLVIDNSGSMKDIRGNVEAAAMAFVRASNPLDDAFVVSFADKVRVDVPLTRDRAALEAGVARVDSIGGTAMRDAVLGAERYMREHATHDRRVLLVVTDGDDNASTASYDELRRTAEETDTAGCSGLMSEPPVAGVRSSIACARSPAASRTTHRSSRFRRLLSRSRGKSAMNT